ncbi:MAG: PorV/PorQ family protein, partial [bacterium]|nr:PorV/PorQ family protein [bacterium]
YQYISFGIPAKNLGAFGVALKYVDYGTFEYTYPTGYTTEPDESGDTFAAYDYSLTFGWGKQLTDSFRFGIGFNYMYEQLEEWKADAYSFDLGFTYQNPEFMKDIRLAFSAGNMGSNVRYYKERWEMPVIARYGLYWNFFKSQNHDFLTVVEFVQYNDAAIKSSLGLEYTLNQRFMLRLGYQSGYDAYDNISAGLGMKLPFASKAMNLDISFNQSESFGSVFRAQIGVQF